TSPWYASRHTRTTSTVTGSASCPSRQVLAMSCFQTLPVLGGLVTRLRCQRWRFLPTEHDCTETIARGPVKFTTGTPSLDMAPSLKKGVLVSSDRRSPRPVSWPHTSPGASSSHDSAQCRAESSIHTADDLGEKESFTKSQF